MDTKAYILFQFCNPFGTKFILRLNLLSICIIKCESYFFTLWNKVFDIDITISMRRASIFSSDMTMIFYCNITINIVIITGPTFSGVLKILIIIFSYYKFYVKMFFHHITTIFTFFNRTANKHVVNSIFV